MTDSYRTVAGPVIEEIEVRRSRFICALAPVTDEDAARAVIAERRCAEPGARHHCHAFVLGPDARLHRSSDDGEPRGTAGVPILEVLLRAPLTDTVAVVSRHFGGIKLGAGGLVRAYSDATSAAVAAAPITTRRRLTVVTITVDYTTAGSLENDLRQSPYPVLSTAFGTSATFEVGVAPDERATFASWLAAATSGTATVTATDERWS